MVTLEKLNYFKAISTGSPKRFQQFVFA